MSDQGCHFVGHWQISVSHCPMTDCYLQRCISMIPYSDLLFSKIFCDLDEIVK